MIIGGHRGHISGYKGNTIANFEEVTGVVSYIEIDVQLTKDKILVLYHDEFVSEIADGKEKVGDFLYSDLQKSFDICTFEEAIAWCSKTKMDVAIEIKSYGGINSEDYAIYRNAVITSISEYDFYEKSFVFGMEYDFLMNIREKDSKIRLGVIAENQNIDDLNLMKKMNAKFYVCYAKNLNLEYVKLLQNNGILVDGSVINTKEELVEAIGKGVDMIESDYPHQIKYWMEK